MKITAVGDCAVQKNMPEFYNGSEEVIEYIGRGDVRFFNLETTVCEDCAPARYSGGTWLRTDPDVLSDLNRFGFNVTTAANNHCMDFGQEGFLQTLKNIKEAGIKQAGGGRNLAEAARPVYIDTPSGRAAVISCVTSFSPGAEAGEQSRDFPGRPGINNLSVEPIVYITPEQMENLKDIAAATLANAEYEMDVRDGYIVPDKEGDYTFLGKKYRIGEPCVKHQMSQKDVDRILTSIKDAVFQADVVLVSVHTHQMESDSFEYVPEFMREFAHLCIDAGAHAILGHGPHRLREFEIYKGLPIFYSLGDFVLHLENCAMLPYDFCQKQGLTPEVGIYEVFKKRTKDFTIGLQSMRVMSEAVIPYFEIEDGKLKTLEFMPVELGYGEPHSRFGWPKRAKDNSILERLSKMSNIEIDENGKAVI